MKNSYKSSIIALAMILAFSVGVFAQERTVQGKVTDGANGEPLPGVNIIEKGTSNGSITDMNGEYSIEVSEDATLVFSFVGYIKEEINVGEQSVVSVNMMPDIEQLEEIVVVGYGEQRREDVTGSIATVKPEEFNKGVISSPQELLTGRTAGVEITNNGGAPGSGVTIRIRGGSSLRAENEPLIIIDGVPVDNEGISGMRNPLSAINPNDIESFNILKDASATAIYGSRASNGVIIVTTKRGKEGEKLKLSYSGNVSVQTIPETVDVLSGDEYRQLINDRVDDPEITTTPAEARDLLGDANTNWQDEIFEPAVNTNHNLSATGSVMDIPYRASVGYTTENGILKTSGFDRTTVSVGIDPSAFDDHLKFKLNFKGGFTENTFADHGAIGSAVTFDPTQPVRDSESPFGGFFFWEQPGNQGEPITIAPTNPVAMLELNDNNATVNRYIGNAQVDYKLHFFPDLKANLNVGFDRSTTEGKQVQSVDLTSTYDPNEGSGIINQYNQEKRNDLIEFYLKYNKELPGASSKIEIMGGYSWQHFWTMSDNFVTNFNGNVVNQDIVSKAENYLVSFYGRLNYNLLDRYILTVNLRRDGSSRFTEDNRWGFFPSAAIGWRISEESFLVDSRTISNLKLRLGYGLTGQQDVSESFYPALARVTTSEDNARYQFGNDFVNTIRYEGFDADLKWEETTTYNAGLDFGFAEGRISGSLDWYLRETNDLLNIIPVPIGTNFTNQILTNVGSLENQGIELSLDGYVIDNENLSWNLGANVTYNENKITKLTLVDDPNYQGALVGGIGGGVGNTIQVHSVGHPSFTFFPYEQVYDENENPIEGLYVDQNEDGIINDLDRIRHKDPAPDYYMGFSSRLNYKNFDFSFNARANLKNYVYNNVSSQYANYQNLYNSTGYINNVTSDVTDTNFEEPRYLSDYYIQNGAFFRLDNISLGYNLNDIAFDKLDVYLNFTVQNAFVITDYEGLDPEVEGGIDNNIYPRPRTYMFGVNVNF